MTMRTFCVLLVDDEVLLLRAMERQLRKTRWRVVSETDSTRALAVARAEGVAAIVSDAWMPNVDGPTLLTAVREELPHVIRVLMSGSADGAFLEGAKRTGLAHHVLDKPWPSSALTGLLEEIHARITREQIRDEVQQGTYVGDPQRIAAAMVDQGVLNGPDDES